MGFTGVLVLAQHSSPETAVPALGIMTDQLTDNARSWFESAYRGDRVDDLSLAHQLVAAVGQPVVVSHVMDSDFALMRGDSPGGHAWELVINRDRCPVDVIPNGYDEGLEAQYQALIDWGREARNRQVSMPAKLARIVSEEYVYAEDGVHRLTLALAGYGQWGDDTDELLRRARYIPTGEEAEREMQKLREVRRQMGFPDQSTGEW